VDPLPHPNYQRRVITKFERVDRATVDAFKDFYTGIVLDHVGKMGMLDTSIGPICLGSKVVGPAVTSLGPDISVRRMAIDLAQPGDVLVVAAGGSPDFACFGDGTARRMQVKGIAGAVIDGAVRDAAGLRALKFPTFARAVTARNFNYPAGIDFGGVNVRVVCGGVLVNPGDLIIGDDDGVVVVERQLAISLREQIANELNNERKIRGSWTTYPPFGVEAELRKRGYVFE